MPGFSRAVWVIHGSCRCGLRGLTGASPTVLLGLVDVRRCAGEGFREACAESAG